MWSYGVVAVSVGLLVFFRFRLFWQHNSIVLFVCAVVLGAAVCGMHFIGMQSATYHLLDSPPSELHSLPSPTVVFAITLCLAGVSCVVALTLLEIKWRHVLRLERAKLRGLVVNAVVLDPTGSLVLTTPTSTLPSVVLEAEYVGQGQFDERNAGLRAHAQGVGAVAGQRRVHRLPRQPPPARRHQSLLPGPAPQVSDGGR